jgi:hypothetical protein
MSFKQRLSRCKRFAFSQKYRFDLGFQFLAMVNFMLLVVTTATTLRAHMELPRTSILLAIALPSAFFGVWLFGWFLDRVVRYGQAYNIEAHRRNPVAERHIEMLREISGKIEDISRRIQ